MVELRPGKILSTGEVDPPYGRAYLSWELAHLPEHKSRLTLNVAARADVQ
jgi:hypothetical protein